MYIYIKESSPSKTQRPSAISAATPTPERHSLQARLVLPLLSCNVVLWTVIVILTAIDNTGRNHTLYGMSTHKGKQILFIGELYARPT